MSHGKSSRSGSSKQTPPKQGGHGDESLPSRPFSLPPGYYELYGIKPPQPTPGAVQTKRAGLNQGPSLPRGLLEYYGIAPRATSDNSPSPVQQKGEAQAKGASARSEAQQVHEAAAHGTSGPSGTLPHIEQIQRAFGKHDVSHIKAHADGPAAESARAMGAEAFATGEHVAFAHPPSLHTAAHEAAHVVQQRSGVQLKGGVGEVGDRYEQHADAVADRVAGGQSAEALLDEMVGARPGGAHGAGATGIQRLPGLEAEKSREDAKKTGADYPKVVTLGQEKVRVASQAEEEEARKIIEAIKNDYGIEVSSVVTVEAIKKEYDQVPDSVKASLKTMEWEMKELRAVRKALAHYAPILGKNRESSSRKGSDQEVTSIGKVKQAIDENTASGALDTETLGEYFEDSKNFGMFKAGTNKTVVFSDSKTELEATAVHEMAHGLLADQYDNFVKSGSDGFWRDRETPSGKKGAEKPPTQYGKESAEEDLAESVMYYFVDTSTLKNKCPKRHEFIKKLVDGWKVKDAVGEKNPPAPVTPIKGGS